MLASINKNTVRVVVFSSISSSCVTQLMTTLMLQTSYLSMLSMLSVIAVFEIRISFPVFYSKF